MHVNSDKIISKGINMPTLGRIREKYLCVDFQYIKNHLVFMT